MPEEPAPNREEDPSSSRSRSHRTLKLMPGGEEGDGHPLSPQEARRARGVREHFELHFEPNAVGVPTWTVASASGQSYRVLLPAFPQREGAQCSCPDFATRGLGTCKHLEATLARAAGSPPPELSDRTPVSPAVTWAEVDRVQSEALGSYPNGGPRDHVQLARALRKVGRLLTSQG